MSNWYIFNVFKKLIFISCLPWWSPKQHFIKDDANRPNITLCCVWCPFEQLWSHVDWTANTGFEHLRSKVVDILGETEVSDLINVIVNENIGRLQVSMDNLFLNEL